MYRSTVGKVSPYELEVKDNQDEQNEDEDDSPGHNALLVHSSDVIPIY